MARRRLISTLLLTICILYPSFSQHLPEGSYQTNRERTYDLIHVKAVLGIDWDEHEILGTATLRFAPLTSLSSVTFDAIGFEFLDARDAVANASLAFKGTERSIIVELGRTLTDADTTEIVIAYVARPTGGLYFVDPSEGTNNQPAIFTYGEGGIHANWLPLYNAPNDKFSSEMIVTVEKPLTAISNGHLVSARENGDGTRTFHWSQSLPHSDYLLGLFVGDYVPVELRKAFGDIPLSVWVHPGQEQTAREVFGRTPDMIEFFSERFSYRFPWDKYDQISAFDYAIGAMENTTITGHNDRILRTGEFEEFNPDFTTYTSNWTAESIISHELAHHWFGDLTTYRNLSQLWLNESFASLLMMLWDEHRLGEQALRMYTTVALTDYLNYVASDHTIRPLEWHYFDTRAQIYNTQITYQKGAIVLNQLRWVLGDEAFFKGLSYFLKKHQFGNVESRDLLIAFEESIGKNLEWYFKDWVWGGGHPVLEVSSEYDRGTHTVEVSIGQVQPMVKGQDLFSLPVDIRIDAAGATAHHRVWAKHRTDHFSFTVNAPPDMISIDGKGYLVADIRYPKELKELLWQINNDDLPGQVRALRQLIRRYATEPDAMNAVQKLFQENTNWYLRAEAAFLLGSVSSETAQRMLLDGLHSPDYHVRKAAVIALGSHPTGAVRKALRDVIEREKVDEVAATAIVSLAAIDPSLDLDFFREQLATPSWYSVRTLGALTAMEKVARADFVPTVKMYANTQSNYAIRTQALMTWAACAPLDEELRDEVLPDVAQNDIIDVRSAAMSLLARLKVKNALPVLRELAEKNGDMDVRAVAKETIEKIER